MAATNSPVPPSSSGLAAWDLAGGRVGMAGGNQRGWIQSPKFDLALFTLSPLAGLFVVVPALLSPKGIHVWIAATYLIAIPHYVSSFSFYMGDENLAYYRTRRLTFFFGPLLILLTVIALRLAKVDALVNSALYSWNVFHVSMQSNGILAIYRRLNGGLPAEGRFARVAILATNATLAFLHIDRFPPIYDPLVRIHFPLWTIRPVFLSVAVIGLVFYLNALRRRERRIGGGELAFLISTFLMFHPYVWVHELNLATYGMLIGHFLQYLGIVWLLNRRKYPRGHGSEQQRLLSSVSASTPLLLFSLVSTGGVFYLALRTSVWLGIPNTYSVLWNSLALIHFYLDGFLWAFRNPFVRKSLGPYVAPSSHMAMP
jgi:hypothetical protein